MIKPTSEFAAKNTSPYLFNLKSPLPVGPWHERDNTMLIAEILARNARMYGQEVALVERDPANNSRKVVTFKCSAKPRDKVNRKR